MVKMGMLLEIVDSIMVKKLILMVCCCLVWPCYAQIRLAGSEDRGAMIGERLDYTGVVARFGTPKEYTSYYDDECYQAQVAVYRYDAVSLQFVDGVLDSFNLDARGGAYAVFVHEVWCVRIGDDLRRFLQSVPDDGVLKRTHGDRVDLYFRINGCGDFYDSSLVLTADKSGRIVNICWFSPV